MFLSLPQKDIKIPWTCKFVAAAFNSITGAPFLKVNISALSHYKVMKQKLFERLIIRVHITMLSFI
jgi:hypothetical protein